MCEDVNEFRCAWNVISMGETESHAESVLLHPPRSRCSVVLKIFYSVCSRAKFASYFFLPIFCTNLRLWKIWQTSGYSSYAFALIVLTWALNRKLFILARWFESHCEMVMNHGKVPYILGSVFKVTWCRTLASVACNPFIFFFFFGLAHENELKWMFPPKFESHCCGLWVQNFIFWEFRLSTDRFSFISLTAPIFF